MPTKTLSRLTAVAVESARFEGRPFKLFDGGGLYLHVTASGRYWRMKYRHAGREKLLSIGVYPDTGLSDAREDRDDARKQVAKGIDPSAAKQAEKQAKKAEQEQKANTFEAVAREWWEQVHRHRVIEDHARDNLRRLELHVFPAIGKLPITDVSAPKLLAVLRVMEKDGHVRNAHRTRTLCGQVFRYAIRTERAERDPAADLRDTLQGVKERHHAALTDPSEFARLLRDIETYAGEPSTMAALRLAPILFARPGELRAARWEDFDLDAGTWAYQPGKGGSPMVTPLPRQAVEILRELHALTGPDGFVFPSARGGDRPLSQSALRLALLKLGYGGKMTPHGFRATARTLLAERFGIPAEQIEMQLGHAVRDANGRSYNRTTWLQQRGEMLQTWADYLDTLREDLVSLSEVAA